MATNLGYVTCPKCEGTGQKLNRFDPPKQPALYGTDKLFENANNKRFSPGGREMFDEKCPTCAGKGKLAKLYDGSVTNF
jgi:DnaJ-class molecular chaperone